MLSALFAGKAKDGLMKGFIFFFSRKDSRGMRHTRIRYGKNIVANIRFNERHRIIGYVVSKMMSEELLRTKKESLVVSN